MFLPVSEPGRNPEVRAAGKQALKLLPAAARVNPCENEGEGARACTQIKHEPSHVHAGTCELSLLA